MPRLPDATSLGERPVPQSRRSVTTDQSGQIVGQAIESAGANLIRLSEQRQERQDRIGYAQARSTLLQADIAARQELENDNDFATYETRYREKLGQARQDAAKLVRGRTDRAIFEQDTAADLERGVAEIRGLARRKEVDTSRASLNDTMQKNRTAALEAKDEGTRAALIQSTQDAIAGAAERDYITAQEAVDQRQRWTADYGEGHLDIQSLPDRIKILQNPKGTPADYIAPDRRAALLKAAQNELKAEQGRAAAEARQILSDQMQDIAAAAQAGIPVKQVPFRAMFQTAFGEKEGAQRYASAQKLANMSVVISSLHGLSAGDLVSVVSKPEPMFVAGNRPKSMIVPGNIDILARPKVKNADGSVSTVRSMSFGTDEGEILVPTVSDDGRIMSDAEAIETYRRTGRHLGIFKDEASATAYAKSLHDQQDEFYNREYFGPPREITGAAEQAQLYGIVGRAVSGILNERSKDPAGYLLTHSEPVQRAWAAFQTDPEKARDFLSSVRAEKERLGIEGDDILPDAYVQGIADDLNTSPTAEQLATRVESEVTRWGDAWPVVQGQLAGKVSDLTLVMGAGIPRSASVALASTMKLKDTEIKAMLPTSTKWADVEADVDTQFADFQRSLPPEAAKTWNAVRDSAIRLSVKYMNDGNSRGDAVNRAYRDLVESQYALTEFRGVTIRIPAASDAEAVEIGARLTLDSFEPDPKSIAVPPGAALSQEEYASEWQNYIRDNGYWVTRPDGKGIRLYADGGPVIGSGGPVEYTWAQLQDSGAAKRASDEAERIQRQREEALKRQQMR